MQRLRLTFARGEEAKYVSHLDLARLWERAVRRAGLPLAYSTGFTPHPRLSFAAPLAVGLTADQELLEMYLSEAVPPPEVLARLAAQLPAGLTLLSVVEEDAAAPSLQSRVRAAEYLAYFRAPVPDLAARVAAFLARAQIHYERRRDGKTKMLDLRPYVEKMVVIEGTGERSAPAPLPARALPVSSSDDHRGALSADDRPSACGSHPHPSPLTERKSGATPRAETSGQALFMRLRFDAAGSVRPDEVLDALGLGEQPVRLHRARLLLE